MNMSGTVPSSFLLSSPVEARKHTMLAIKMKRGRKSSRRRNSKRNKNFETN
jgi:hypothetical protein